MWDGWRRWTRKIATEGEEGEKREKLGGVPDRWIGLDYRGERREREQAETGYRYLIDDYWNGTRSINWVIRYWYPSHRDRAPGT